MLSAEQLIQLELGPSGISKYQCCDFFAIFAPLLPIFACAALFSKNYKRNEVRPVQIKAILKLRYFGVFFNKSSTFT